MVFKNLCVSVLWMKVAIALGGLILLSSLELFLLSDTRICDALENNLGIIHLLILY